MRPSFLRTLLTAGVVIATSIAVFPRPSHADPGTAEWTNTRDGATDRTVGYGETIRLSFSGATDSRVLEVLSTRADLCFDPDSLGTAGSTRVTVYRVIDASATTIDGSIVLPTVPTDNSDCIVIVVGTYWVEVTAGPTGGEVPVLTVSGRSS